MQIKKFKASTMTKALKKVKNEFGSEAVILSARNISSGKNIFNKAMNNTVEVTAAIDNNIQIKNNKEQIKSTMGTYLVNTNVSKQKTTNKYLDERKKEITKFKYIGSEEKQKFSINNKNLKELFLIYQGMLAQDLDIDVATLLIRELMEIQKKNAVLEATNYKKEITNILYQMGLSDKRIKLQKEKKRIVAFVGKSGVGKTTTAAKIAAFGKRYLEPDEVGMISLDDSRIGAFEQSRIYANIIGYQIETATNQNEFSKAVERLASKNLILIDTPGINPKDKKQLENIANYLTTYNPIEIHLLMDAGNKFEDMKNAINLFNFIPISHLIFTKLDETTTYGNILGHLIYTKLPVSYFTWGHKVPEDLENGSLIRIIEKILKNINFEQRFFGPPELIADHLYAFEKLINEKADYFNKNNRSIMSYEPSFLNEKCV